MKSNQPTVRTMNGHGGQMDTVRRKGLSLVLCTLFIGGCAAMSKDECLTVDWLVRGHTDGTEGRPSSRVDEYVEACTKHNIPVNVSQYESGRREGVQAFCTRENGFAAALTGYQDVGACTPDNVEHFLSGYEPGRKMYAADKRVRDAHGTISKSVSLIARNRNEIESIHKQLWGEDDLSDKKINRLSSRATRLQNQIIEAQTRITTTQSVLPSLVHDCLRTKVEMEEAGFEPNIAC